MRFASPTAGRLAACALTLLLGAGAAPAQEDKPFDRTPQDCVTVSAIDATEAVDDQNVIFRMRGQRVFRNHLPRRCPGLERENRFMYETRNGRLCSIDTITVLEQFGVGFQRGFTCRLGEFVPLSPEEIEDLDFQKEQASAQRAIRAEPVQRRRERREAVEREASPAEPAPAAAEGSASAAPAPSEPANER